MIKVNRTKAIELIKDTNGRIFSVGFYKKDKSFRAMVARLGKSRDSEVYQNER